MEYLSCPLLRSVDPPPFLGKRDRFVCVTGIERNHGGKLRIRDLSVECIIALKSIDVGNKKKLYRYMTKKNLT